MRLFVILVFFLSGFFSFAQDVKDYKLKTSKNASERTEILDLLRNEIKNDLDQEVLFQVKHLKISGNYAWFEGNAIRNDGKSIEFPDESYDCCHVEGLFERKNGKWTLLEFGTFSTDCWYCGIAERYPHVPRSIFTESAFNN